MCGILGVYSKRNTLFSKELFADTLKTMLHRGPDAQGIIYKPPIYFGHNRLSILDLSNAANQPFFSASQRSVIIFNGEIYNYLSLKQGLQTKGYHFHTQSDTEVLLTLYEHAGIENTLKKLNGMFAFAIFDFQRQALYLARDHSGIKPLFYFNNNDYFSFASEPTALLKIHPESKKLNLQAFSSYLSCRYPILGDSFFEGIETVPPGHYLTIQNQEIKKTCYWNLAACFTPREINEADAITQLESLLREAVKLQKRADVKAGTFLSGG